MTTKDLTTTIQTLRPALLQFAAFFTFATALVALCVVTVVLAFQIALGSGSSDPMPALIAVWTVIGMISALWVAR